MCGTYFLSHVLYQFDLVLSVALLQMPGCQICDDCICVFAVIANLCVLSCLDLDERGVGESGKRSSKFCLAASSWSSHQNVLRVDDCLKSWVKLSSSPS